MSEEKKAFGRVKGQTKSQSIISDASLSPYEIQVDDYSFTVIDSTKTGNNFCGSFTRLENAVNKIAGSKSDAPLVEAAVDIADIVVDPI